MDQDERSEPPVASMLKAAGKAVLVWLSIYLFCLHCLVVWKWNTIPVASAATTISSTNNESVVTYVVSQDNSAAVLRLELFIKDQLQEMGVVQQDIATADRLLQSLDERAATLQQVQSTVDTELTVVTTALKNIVELAEELDERQAGQRLAAAAVNSVSSSQTEDALQLLRDFFIRTTETPITQASDEEIAAWMNDDFFGLFSDLVDTEESAVDWAQVTAVFQSDEWDVAAAVRDVAAAAKDQVCVSNGDDDEGNKAATLADEDALQDAVDNFISRILDQRGELEPPVYLPKTLESIQSALLESVQELTVAVQATAAAPVMDKAENCIRATALVPWIDAGLEALSRRKDTRPALLHQLALDSLDTSEIILDAVLEDDDTATLSKIQPSDKVSLRQWLGTPVMMGLAPAVLDVFLDLVSGYNDYLDELLDSFVNSGITSASTSDDDKSNSIGHKVVGRTLQAAGGVQIPIPPALRQTKLGSRIPNH